MRNEEVFDDYYDPEPPELCREHKNRSTLELSQVLGVPPSAVQVIDADKWRREDETFARETRRLVAAYRRD